MATVVKDIGNNNYHEFGSAIASLSSVLVDGGINKLSTKIKEIVCGNEFLIYWDKEYENIWSAG